MNAQDMTTTVGKNIEYYLMQTGITKTELAKRLGVDSSTITTWTIGRSMPRNDKIEKLCELFGITLADLMLDHDVLSDRRAEHKSIPLYGEISAGIGFFSDDNILKYIAIDKSIKGDFAVIVKGASMINAGIQDGDIAILSKTYQFKDGNIYAMWQTGEGLSYLKRVYLQNNKFLLLSENPAFAPLTIENNEAVILGELCGIYHNITQ